jgi:glucose-6-phosphate 1-dehydrogenase
MKAHEQPDPTSVVIFGAGGDLTHRKLLPALYNLFVEKWLPGCFTVIGLDRRSITNDEWRTQLRQGIDTFSRRGKTDDATWNAFAPAIEFQHADFSDPASYAALAARLDAKDKACGVKAGRIFYLAVPPTLFETVAVQLGKAKLARDRKRVRIVIEKPFGSDLDSARALNKSLTAVFEESQIYRIDHYLGKETVQNILALRFANSLFEPIWNRRYIDHVQITVAEEVGVEHRGGYYEGAGALRDMVQNHLTQVLCLVAMEPPVSYEAEEIRNRKVDVLRAIHPLGREEVMHHAVRGQYGEGYVLGQCSAAYRAEPGVAPDSATETYAAVKLFIDNWRWQGVPFYLRTGKRLAGRVSEVCIVFRSVPHQPFPRMAMEQWEPNRLVIRIQPDEGIMLVFQAKLPGEQMRLSPVAMRFSYKESFHIEPPEAYETLLLDVCRGDATQFMRADQLEAAWRVIMPILEVWNAAMPSDFPNYGAGSWGPQAASTLIAQDGRSWIAPNLHDREPFACAIKAPET